jgi:hypothetical protein
LAEHIPEKLHGFSDKNMHKNKQIERFGRFRTNENACLMIFRVIMRRMSHCTPRNHGVQWRGWIVRGLVAKDRLECDRPRLFHEARTDTGASWPGRQARDMKKMTELIIGIDISKAVLDVHRLATVASACFGNDLVGFKALRSAHLAKNRPPPSHR